MHKRRASAPRIAVIARKALIDDVLIGQGLSIWDWLQI
jgi:hypothetical protein